MAEKHNRPRLSDWLITALVLVVTILLAIELATNVHHSRDGSQTCITTELTG